MRWSTTSQNQNSSACCLHTWLHSWSRCQSLAGVRCIHRFQTFSDPSSEREREGAREWRNGTAFFQRSGRALRWECRIRYPRSFLNGARASRKHCPEERSSFGCQFTFGGSIDIFIAKVFHTLVSVLITVQKLTYRDLLSVLVTAGRFCRWQ